MKYLFIVFAVVLMLGCSKDDGDTTPPNNNAAIKGQWAAQMTFGKDIYSDPPVSQKIIHAGEQVDMIISFDGETKGHLSFDFGGKTNECDLSYYKLTGKTKISAGINGAPLGFEKVLEGNVVLFNDGKFEVESVNGLLVLTRK